MTKRKPLAIAVMGPTASGKSAVAEELSASLNARIVNADAFQVYRGLDIGTNKPVNRGLYELIDILEPWDSCTAGRFVSLARPICVREAEAGRHCIVCGGTGLYVRALFEEYTEMGPPPNVELRKRLQDDLRRHGPNELLRREGINPEEAPREALANPVRLVRLIEQRRSVTPEADPQPAWRARRFKFGLRLPREALQKRMEKRLAAMGQNGWQQEVESLIKGGASPEWPAFKAIGYCEMIACCEGALSPKEAYTRILVQTQQYAKRQMTWLRMEPGLIWIDADCPAAEAAERIIDAIRRKETRNG